MRATAVLLLKIAQLAQAGFVRHVRSTHDLAFGLGRRQDGYNPEFGACGTGQTCAEACGDEFESCSVNETSILFCYNPSAGQTCCPGGSGRACDAGFYCVSDPDGGETYCCDEQSDLSRCTSDLGISTAVLVTPTSSSTKTATTRSTSKNLAATSTFPTSTSSTTVHGTSTAATTEPGSGYPSTPTVTTTTTGNGTNSTMPGSATSPVVTAGAPPVTEDLHALGVGVVLVGWVMMML